MAEPSSSMRSRDHTGTGLLRFGFSAALLGRSPLKKKRASFLALGGIILNRDPASRLGLGSMFPAPPRSLLGLHPFWSSVPEGLRS